MIKDWNRGEVKTLKDVFHFKNSLRPFVVVDSSIGDPLFIDIKEGIAYSFDEVYEELNFYTKENEEGEEEEDFLGVEVDGTIKEWF